MMSPRTRRRSERTASFGGKNVPVGIVLINIHKKKLLVGKISWDLRVSIFMYSRLIYMSHGVCVVESVGKKEREREHEVKHYVLESRASNNSVIR